MESGKKRRALIDCIPNTKASHDIEHVARELAIPVYSFKNVA